AVRAGPTMAASDSFDIRVIGRQTHGSRPWGGVDPVVAAAQIVSQAQAIVSRQMDISHQPAVLTFGTIHGGIRHNIIPDDVMISRTIRTCEEHMSSDILARLEHVAGHAAAANGAAIEPRIPRPGNYPVTFNNPALTECMRIRLKAVAWKDK